MHTILRKRAITSYFHAAIASDSRWTETCTTDALDAFNQNGGKQLLAKWVNWGEPKSLFWDHPRLLRKVTRPTLVMWGASNPWIPYDQIERLGRHVEDNKIIALSGCSHFPSIDNLQRAGREVSAFLGLI